MHGHMDWQNRWKELQTRQGDEPMIAPNNPTEVDFALLEAANAPIYGGVNLQLHRRDGADDGCNTNSLLHTDHYTADHRIAKLVIFLAYILLGAISVEIGNPYIALVAGTCIWFFGINTVGHIVESVLGHRHTHCWL